MTNLNELQFFVQVSQTQSFTKAAKQLGVPKSSVSRAILRLETRLGVRLVERTTRRVALTELGELYLSRCRRVMEEAQQADLAIGALQATPRGTLRIGAPVAFARSILGPTMGEFLALYPGLRLHLQLLNGDESPRESSLDVIVRAGALEDSGLLVKPLMRIRLGAYASPAYLANCKLPGSPVDLLQLSCITTSCDSPGEPGDFITWRLRRAAELKEVRIQSRVSVPDPTINHQLALAGAGVALLAQSVVQADVEQNRLARVLPDWEPDPIELHALYPSRLDSSPKVRALLQFLRERFSPQPPLEPQTVLPELDFSRYRFTPVITGDLNLQPSKPRHFTVSQILTVAHRKNVRPHPGAAPSSSVENTVKWDFFSKF